jgi:hypothetical protein
MLAVVCILGILLALVVGIQKYVHDLASKEATVGTQRIVMDAILFYRDRSGGALPGDSPDCVQMMKALYDDEQTKPKLANVPQDAWWGPNSPLMDGWGRKMGYKNVGGMPLLVSAGANGKFGDDDDVRSDRY